MDVVLNEVFAIKLCRLKKLVLAELVIDAILLRQRVKSAQNQSQLLRRYKKSLLLLTGIPWLCA